MIVLGMAATISYIGDPGELFGGHGTYEQEMVNILQSGHNVINKENMDWGKFRSTLIARDFIRPNTIVLGSSRVMEISNEMLDVLPFPQHRVFFNSWSASATLGDIISIVMCFVENGKPPGTIILGIDPYYFYKEGLTFPSLAKYYSLGLKQIGYTSSGKNTFSLLDKEYYELISYPYVIAALSKILREDSHPAPTDEIYGEGWIDLQDGRRSWPKSFREKTGAVVASEIRVAQPVIKTIRPPSKMNPNQIKLFDAFNTWLLKHGVRAVFFIPPWHPIMYHNIAFVPGNREFVESESYICKYAEEKNIMVIGSFDPDQYNLTSSDFYDGSHARPDAIMRIFAISNAGRWKQSRQADTEDQVPSMIMTKGSFDTF